MTVRQGLIGQNRIARDPFAQGGRHLASFGQKVSLNGVLEVRGETEVHLERAYALATHIRLTLMENGETI